MLSRKKGEERGRKKKQKSAERRRTKEWKSTFNSRMRIGEGIHRSSISSEKPVFISRACCFRLIIALFCCRRALEIARPRSPFSVFSFSLPSSHGAWARCETKGKQELSGSSFWVAGMVGFECVRVNRNFCGSPHWVSVEILPVPVGAAKAACKKMHKFLFSSFCAPATYLKHVRKQHKILMFYGLSAEQRTPNIPFEMKWIILHFNLLFFPPAPCSAIGLCRSESIEIASRESLQDFQFIESDSRDSSRHRYANSKHLSSVERLIDSLAHNSYSATWKLLKQICICILRPMVGGPQPFNHVSCAPTAPSSIEQITLTSRKKWEKTWANK